jgi:hypothetical protein
VHLPTLMTMVAKDIPATNGDCWKCGSVDPSPALLNSRMCKPSITICCSPRVLRLMSHPHEHGRRQGINLLADLELKDFHRVADPMVHLIRNTDASYDTYHSEHARKNALAILERLNIQEGIDLAIETIPGGWGLYWRLRGPNGRLEIVKRYGANAKPYIPKLKALKMKQADEAITVIEAATETRDLITLEEAKAAGKQ